MLGDGIVIKGNREGLNAIINMNKFRDFDQMLRVLIDRLSKGKNFYKGASINVIIDLKCLNEKNLKKLETILFDEFSIKDCVFEDRKEKKKKFFDGIYEGKTKFITKTIRSGQVISYSGNLVIIGNVNSGAEVYADGNVVVLGILKGYVHAGFRGNSKAIVAALCLQPSILRISNIMTRSPEDNVKPRYPEVAKIREKTIIVEPYIPNKYMY